MSLEILVYYEQYVKEWEEELKAEKPFLTSKSIDKIDDCLELHKIEKIAKKFPLLPIAVNLYKGTNHPNRKIANLWTVPIDLRKLSL